VTRPILTQSLGFSPNVVDKVERLLEVLEACRDDPYLHDALVLHGGSALNLFYDDAPRLSVDIDLMFVGEDELDKMRAVRPEVDRRIRRALEAIGYVVQGTNDEHSGQTYRVKYPGDFVKLDVSYLARVTVLAPDVRRCTLAEPQVGFPVVRLPELIAGKVKAMMERVAARDLFDLYRLSQRYPDAFTDALTRALTIRSISAADSFPSLADPAAALERFRPVAPDFTAPLSAMLRSEDVTDFDQMQSAVTGWLRPLATLSDEEAEYMRLLDEEATYAPELLLGRWPEAAARALRDPVMEWKVRNLASRIARG